jgi:UDP-N-acetylmuramoylalanine--D-glutamate ligase
MQDMRIGIVGWGVETQSAVRYFGTEHEYLICNEEPIAEPPSGANITIQVIDQARPAGTTGNVKDYSYLSGIENCDKIFYSPTAAKNLEELFGNSEDFWGKTTTSIQLFFETVATKNIIGITGTKGKGTTSTLLAKMLEAAGKKVWLGGNIGRGFLDFVRDIQPGDWVILELSSFQLYKLKYSPHIGVCLMITEEHLDWHPNMNDYVQTKANLFRWQKADDIAIYLAGNSYTEQVAGYSKGRKIPFGTPPGAYAQDEGVILVGDEGIEVIKTDQLKLIGGHNLQNVCAAVTAFWQISQDVDAVKRVLSTFSGLEHRLEFVREVNGIEFYDDSYGTNPDTAIVALETFVQPVVLIAGGYDRGIPMEKLVTQILKDRVRHVVAIGQTGSKIAEMLKAKRFSAITEGLKTMPEIVAAAAKAAQPGDVVLLSCAATSFDMFPNFKVRGEEFKKAVNAL